MKIVRLLVMVALAVMPVAAASAQENQAAGAGQSAASLSPGVADVIKLANAGVSDEVIIAHIEKSHQEFALTSDDIIALNNSKVSPRVITAILQHEGLVGNDQQEASTSPPPASTVQAPPPAVVIQTPPPYIDDDSTTIVEGPAPAPLVEVMPLAPGPNYFWRPGHWYWNGGWVWMSGSWLYRRPWVVPVRPMPPRPIVVPDRGWRRW